MTRILLLFFLFLPTISFAESKDFSGHLVWVLTAAQFVIFMTLPGLAVFYGGLVKGKNVLSLVGQCFVIAALTILFWVIFGYSLSFSNGGPLQALIGGSDFFFFNGVNFSKEEMNIEQHASIIFQMGFAIITPALITGGFAERMKFSALIFFILLWELFVYFPVAHWVWGGGWLQTVGVLDFAGGTVVHVNAGVAGLISAIMIGKRRNKKEVMEPHNITLVAIGTGILWFGWIGFNAGGASSIESATLAALNTHLAAAAAAVTWMYLDWFKYKKFSVLALLFGALTGLVAITPAAGYVGHMGSIAIGVIASITSAYVSSLKHKYDYDDALDAFGMHGFGGIIGSILTGIFASSYLGGVGFSEGRGMMQQVGLQCLSVIVTVVWSGGITFLILWILKLCSIQLRVSPKEEESGLDISYHGEQGYRF